MGPELWRHYERLAHQNVDKKRKKNKKKKNKKKQAPSAEQAEDMMVIEGDGFAECSESEDPPTDPEDRYNPASDSDDDDLMVPEGALDSVGNAEPSVAVDKPDYTPSMSILRT